MNEDEVLNELFQKAVSALDAGDIATLELFLVQHPELVKSRLEAPGDWLRSQVGNALEGFFHSPYLLWFIAEDPVRNGKLPENIVQITQAILKAIQRERPEKTQEQLDYALQLVCFSWIARDCGVQTELIDALIDAGASMASCTENALINGNFAAVDHLIKRGAPRTFAVALFLEDWEDIERLAMAVNTEEKQRGLVLAALHGKSTAVARALELGAEVNTPSATLYSHGTPLHHAVCSGSLETVKVLVEAGADKSAKDAAYQGTPLGWATHSLEGQKDQEGREKFAAIIHYLSE